MTIGPESLEAGVTAGRDSRLAQLIISIFGLCARAEGNWLSVAAVVALMADLGVDGQAVRSAVSRLKRRGVLVGSRRDGGAGYSLSAQTLEILAEGDNRIFRHERAVEEDGWVLIVFSVPESERAKRHALRSILTRFGFGTAASGVWVAPAVLADDARRALERHELTPYADVFIAQHAGFDATKAKVHMWWDLAELEGLYREFLRRYRPVLYRVTAEELTAGEAFQIYLPMLTEWRRLPYRDPGIPLTLLPAGWNGQEAGLLFSQLNSALNPLAQRHALAVIHGQGAGHVK